MLDLAEPALFYGETVRADLEVTNRDRAIGTAVGSEITRRYGGRGLPAGTLSFHLKGSAGQSLGAFLPAGITLRCEGDANDYVAKGLSGGTVAVFPPAAAKFRADVNVIAGNVILYGATSGKAFLCGKVGERFAVRNSGASAVVEGVGDHACEYMTGGVVVVIGGIGRNFAAGMSGGVAYVLGDPGDVEAKVNLSMVALRPMSEDDLSIVRELLEQHRELTGSEVANGLLLGWDAARLAFTKIMPLEYERVLRERERQRLETLEPPTSGVVAAE
jgi:glutamate synthase domain-containing protein 3